MSRNSTDSNQKKIFSFFVPAKQKHNFGDKNDFITKKINESVQKTLIPNEQVQNKDEQDNEIKILRQRNLILEKDLKHAKILLRKASDLNLQKDFEIKMLKQQLNIKNPSAKKNELLFETYSHRFDSTEMKCIRSVKSGKRNDSAFILAILKALYKNEWSKLKQRRVTGRNYNGASKIEISAEKKQIMREMFNERLSEEIGSDSNEADEFASRSARLNALMRYALHNSTNDKKNQQKKRCTQNETNRISPQKDQGKKTVLCSMIIYIHVEYF